MRLQIFILAIILVLCFSCRTARDVNKFKASIDSTGAKTSQSVEKSDKTVTLESKSVTQSQDSVKTKADSAKGDFSFHPGKDSIIEVEVESGSVKASVSINPKTGKGSLAAYKKPETIPVNKYQEQSSKATFTNLDSNAHKDSSQGSLKKEDEGKVVHSQGKFSLTSLDILVALLIVLLALGYYIYFSITSKSKS